MVSANPTGPLTVAAARNGAYGDSVARLLAVRRTRGRARVLLQRRRRPDGPVPRLRRGASARGEEPPEDGYHGAYIAELAAEPGDPVPAMLERDRGDARALPDPLRLVGAPERARAEIWSRLLERLDDLRARTGRSSCARPTSATTRTACSSARRGWAGCRPTRRPTSPTCATSSSGGTTAPSTCSAPTTTASRAGTRVVARMLGYDARAGRGAPLPARPPHAGRRAGEDVQAARRRRLPRRLPRRGRGRLRPLVPRRPRPRPDDRDRRRPRASRSRARTPSTTSSTCMRGSAGSSARPPRAPRSIRRRGCRSRPRSASSSSGLPSFPESSARRPSGAARMRSPSTRSGSPTTSTASTTSTVVLAAKGGEHESFRLALVGATRDVVARCLDLLGVDAPERM